eukprot:scaffold234014_cov50-Prasinocladus_malaysianus.AAC.2
MECPLEAKYHHEWITNVYGPNEDVWPIPGVPFTTWWVGAGPTRLHTDDYVLQEGRAVVVGIPLSYGMVGGSFFVLPELQLALHLRPTDFYAFKGRFLHGSTVPYASERSGRLVVSLWIDPRVAKHEPKDEHTRAHVLTRRQIALSASVRSN